MLRIDSSALSSPTSRGFVAALALGALVLTPAVASADDRPRPVDRRGEKLRIVPDLAVDLWTDKGSGAFYCVGETLEISFRTNDDAYVAVFDTDTRGVTRQIFPNRYDREHFVRGGVTYDLPARGYRFEVEGPPGEETLRIVAAPTRRELRRAIDDLIHSRSSRPAAYDGPFLRSRGEKLVVVPDDVAYASISHRVRDGRRCHVSDRRSRRGWRY